MKQIKLTQGKYAIVDNDDYKELNKHKWYLLDGRYAARVSWRKGDSLGFLMHRIILKVKKEEKCDHINNNGLDNRKQNLRICTLTQNQGNRIKQKNNTSGFKGVCLDKKSNKWKSAIHIKSVTKCLGRYKDKIEAAKEYDKAAKKYFGEFARLNFN